MKIVHVPFCFYPDPVGGTEVYVESLTRELRMLDAESIIAAPCADHNDRTYEHDGFRVRRFPVAPQSREMLRELYGAGDPHAAARFAIILDEERPDVVHLHAFTRGVSLLLAREARRRRMPVVFTYHSPTVSCQRGTLMRYGREVCDGVLNRRTCTRCTLNGLGVNGLGGRLLSAVPAQVGNALGRLHLEGGAWTALRMTELVMRRQDAFRELMQESDAVVALCEWTRQVLLSNAVPDEKIIVSGHGLRHEPATSLQDLASTFPINEAPLRVAFMGRLDRTKGPDLLVQALRTVPHADITLDLYGVAQGPEGTDYLQELQALAADNKRIRFHPPVTNDQVRAVLRGYHLLAVPSRCLETGPLVVLEAFAAGTPVVGSKLGGIAELVEHEMNGLLIEPDSVASWAATLQRCAEDRSLLARLRTGVRPPRTMAAVAEEMLALYEGLPGSQKSAPAIAC